MLLRPSGIRIRTLLVAGVAALFGVGCEPAGSAPSGKINIVATTGMVADIVREVAGDHAQVTGLMGEGVDPHLYKPTNKDSRAVLGADMVFYNGLMLEGRMGDAMTKAGRKGVDVYAVTEELDEQFLLEPAAMAGHWDPHVWMDVSAWSRAVTVVANALGEYDPDHQVDYQKHAAAYQAQLAELDDYVRRVIGSIPESKRILVTAHDAFNYFARAYGMQVEGVQGISTESEAGLKRINGLVDLLVDRKISAVFRESSVSAKHVDALIDGARSRGHTVAYGGELFSDAMGATGTYEGTYIGMLDHNATTIARALGGEAPKKGLNGELTLVGQAH